MVERTYVEESISYSLPVVFLAVLRLQRQNTNSRATNRIKTAHDMTKAISVGVAIACCSLTKLAPTNKNNKYVINIPTLNFIKYNI